MLCVQLNVASQEKSNEQLWFDSTSITILFLPFLWTRSCVRHETWKADYLPQHWPRRSLYDSLPIADSPASPSLRAGLRWSRLKWLT